MYQQHSRLQTSSRRGFVTAGVVGALGLNLADFFALRQLRAAQQLPDHIEAQADSIIQIFMPGGLAAQESFDPKPLAPIEYRGELKAIDTKIPGEKFCETLAKTAGVADRLTIVRSMTHGEAAHERGQHNMMTGYKPSPALLFPSMGSVVSHEYGPRKNLPPYVCIPNPPNEYSGSGYLSSSFAPFSLGDDPAREGFRVRDLNLPDGVDEARDARRRQALAAVNEHFTNQVKADNVEAMNTFYQRAFDLLGSKEAREAFNIEAEPAELRDRYGRNPAGQRMLMARRLVEAGVRFVTLSYGGWDNHVQITQNVQRQMPAFDQAFSTLILDLEERGLLDKTVVLVTTEFGRTPKVNAQAGRDHWPKVFSVALAGGSIKRGAVVGSSGPTATEPEDVPIGPGDLAATLYHQLGIVAEKELMAPGDRPIEIVKDGAVRPELLA